GLESSAEAETEAASNLFDQVAAYEKTLIAAELKRNDGSIKATYENLGLSRKALYEKMKKYGLERKDAQ
ncbi:MAG: helix-turn-helix domain-containing protein, partial [Roseibium sp.]